MTKRRKAGRFALALSLAAAVGCGPAETGEATPDVAPVWRPESVGFVLDRVVCGSICSHDIFRSKAPTEAQVQALGRLMLFTASGMCGLDGRGAELTIVDQDGRRRLYRWHELPCGDRMFLREAGYQAFAKTVPSCRNKPPAVGCNEADGP